MDALKFAGRMTPNPAELVIQSPGLKIYHGHAETWPGAETIDLVFTNPYGPLPRSLAGKPMIVHQWTRRLEELAAWCHTTPEKLRPLGTWNRGREGFYTLNLEPFPVNIERFNPEPGGWYPPWLVDEIFGQFWAHRWYDPEKEEERRKADHKFTVWDGFMGRGTLARVMGARSHELRFVGVEELGRHIDVALEYLAPLW